MQPIGVGVSESQSVAARQLPLERYGRLSDVRRAHIGVDLFDSLPARKSGKRRNRWNRGVKSRVADNILLLHDTVEARGGENVAESEAIIEDTEATPKHCLRRPVGASARRPCHCNPGRPIPMIVDVGLRFIAQAEAEREIGAQLPVIAEERRDVELAHGERWLPGSERELARAAAEQADLRGAVI